MAAFDDNCDSDGPVIDDNVIRIQLRKPNQRKWELRTRNHSPGVRFPTIQLFDCEGNLLVETNDENISIKSADFDDCNLKTSQSLKLRDYKHVINKNAVKKNKSAAGDLVYTRVYRKPLQETNGDVCNRNGYILRNDYGIENIPNKLTTNLFNLQPSSIETSPLQSEVHSEISSLKSSDDENDNNESGSCKVFRTENVQQDNDNFSDATSSTMSLNENFDNDFAEKADEHAGLSKSKSFKEKGSKECFINCLQRSKSGLVYSPPKNKVSFLDTYMKSLPNRTESKPNWTPTKKLYVPQKSLPPIPPVEQQKTCPIRGHSTQSPLCNKSDSETDYLNIPTDVAADCEMRKRLKMYRRGISEIDQQNKRLSVIRRHSLSGSLKVVRTSSSESVDEADLVLSRLRRRIIKNKMRERKQVHRGDNKSRCRSHTSSGEGWQDVSETGRRASRLRDRRVMGSNISQHSAKGLKGRRARSSGDLCNGDTISQTESSVRGSVVGDVMGWNRSLPNHLDGNRHLADYPRVNNNYGDFGTYNRYHPKGGRGLRYRVFKNGPDAHPVWKLQDPGCDQGYGSERSPEDEYVAQIPPAASLEQYEAQLRNMYPFITDDNTFTVVVEKDGRGLGMSVCGGSGGLVRIRRLYPPQPAWKTGRLAPKDLLLAANGVPLAGLSTYEALEVLRTTSSRVELRVCRPPPDVIESVTPPDPPTPPVRTPHPPLDPLNCHPLHTRLSATTSSATTSSSEGRGKREGSPEDRRGLTLPDLDRPLPVYDVQYGEFDILMTKVNGSLGFTLRKEDHSALGHYVRALVREPALSDGRIQPGDRIVAVNDTPMSNMSHSEAVAYLRACGSEVRLRLYRDHAATPVSPMSPKEEGPTDESDAPLSKPKTPLRPEAVSMLYDLAARRLTPDVTDGSRSPCLSPRKFRRLTKENNHYEQPTYASHEILLRVSPEKRSVKSQGQLHKSHSLTSSPTPSHSNRKKLSLTVPPQNFELNNLDNDTLDAPNLYQESDRFPKPHYQLDSDEPVSMPVELTSDEARFKHTNPAYQSAMLHTSSEVANHSEGHKDEGNCLKKWKGVTLSPNNERKPIIKEVTLQNGIQKENVKPVTKSLGSDKEPTIMTVELNRGWNSRLGFSVQSHPESGQSYISAVYNDSVAARDGRLQQGDVILQVNDENVTSMKTPEVIDLLRILRGSICITVLRPPNPQ